MLTMPSLAPRYGLFHDDYMCTIRGDWQLEWYGHAPLKMLHNEQEWAVIWQKIWHCCKKIFSCKKS